jgi:hypothetical protein
MNKLAMDNRIKIYSLFNEIIENEECHAAKGKQTCSCIEAQMKFVNFFIEHQKLP